MATDPERARILAGHAARAGCGVESMAEGLLCTYAASVDCLHSLAQRMLAAQAELAVLLPPPWFPRVQQYLASDDPDPDGLDAVNREHDESQAKSGTLLGIRGVQRSQEFGEFERTWRTDRSSFFGGVDPLSDRGAPKHDAL